MSGIYYISTTFSKFSVGGKQINETGKPDTGGDT